MYCYGQMANRPHRQSGRRWVEGEVDKRRSEREDACGTYLKSPVRAMVLDMGSLGICIESHYRFAPLERRTLTLVLGASRATVRGEIRWCRFTGSTKIDDGEWQAVYRSGINLLETISLRPNA